MTTTAQRTRTNNAPTNGTPVTGAPVTVTSAAPPVRGGRRDGRRVAVGVLLVVATVAVFWQVDLRRHVDDSFLVTACPVAAGQVIGEADVRVVRVANASGLALLPAAQLDAVVGHTATVPLAEGSLLTAGQLGPAAWPPAGQAVIAVAVKPGRAPSDLVAGTPVIVLVTAAGVTAQNDQPAAGTPGGAGGAVGATRASATVVSVTESAEQAGTRLVTLLLGSGPAETVAAASGEVALVQLGPKE